MLSKRNSGENDRWELQTPKHHMQMKFYANPFKGVDLYSQFNANTNDLSDQKKRFFLEKAWGKFWTPKAEIIVLKREERHFLDSPLLRLIDQEVKSNKACGSCSPESLGIRANFWDFHKLKGNLILSVDDTTAKKLSPQEGEWYGYFYDQSGQSLAVKTDWEVYKKKGRPFSLEVGAVYLRKDWQYEKFAVVTSTNSGARSFLFPGEQIRPKNEVFAAQSKIRLWDAFWNTEIAISTSLIAGSVGQDGERTAFATEFRDLRLGNLLFQAQYFDYGKNFRSELSRKFTGRKVRVDGKNEFDRRGYFTEINYFLEKKLVQITLNRIEYITSFESSENNPALKEDYLVRFSSVDQKVMEQYGEVFVQFVGGLEGRLSGRHFKNKSGDFWGTTIELKGENPFGLGRVQVRIKDIGSETGLGERLIVGGEFRVNLTERMQILTRWVNVQSNYLQYNWWSGFGQLRYFIGNDMECYFEYGDGDPTGNLANDNKMADDPTRKPVDQIKMIFKINF